MSTTPIGQFRVKPRLTTNRWPRTRRYTENTDYAGFVTRVLRAHGRRVAEGDIEALTELSALSVQLDQAITDAITGLRNTGYSWSEIAARLGITKQAAHQRWWNPA
jgi:hypothetical protein